MTARAGWSRRDFLLAAGAAGGALVVGFTWGCSDGTGNVPSILRDSLPDPEGDPLAPNAFVAVYPTGAVVLTVHRSEMGQGIRTACAMLLAEELEVGLDQVRVEQADGHPRYGDQNTDGSRSVRYNYRSLRQAGAAAREMLISAAAARWGAEPSVCEAERGRVRRTDTGEALEYGELASEAAALDPPADPPLKAREDFDLLGTDQPQIDTPDIVTGRAVFGADVVLDGMVTAVLARAPTRSGRPVRWNEEAALSVPGVRQVLEIPADPGRLYNAAVAVVADHTWAALQGREALAVEWDLGAESTENSDAFARTLEDETARPGRVVREEGDVDAAVRSAARTVEAVYHGPYLVHAPMEPMALVARVSDDGVEVWAPTQHPQWARTVAAGVAEVLEEMVQVHVTLLGGGFGRKSKPDFVAEAVAVARQVDAPVRVQWTRDDEVRHGWYRAQNCQRFRATLDGEDRVTSWLHRTAFPPIGSSFDPGSVDPSGGELGQGATNVPYRIPNVRVEAGQARPQVRIGWLRSVCNTFHARGVACFMDELAEAAGQDPAAFLLKMLGEPRILDPGPADDPNPYPFDTGRLTAVLRRVMDETGWNQSGPPEAPEGEAWGVAIHYSFLTYVATAVRAGVENGMPVVREVHVAVDCGVMVNPDTVRAQMEGSVAFGLSYALYGRITVEDSVVQQANFDDYPILRLSEMPRVHVHLVESDALPTGIGEPGVPPVAPALLNALYRITGRRIYDLPLSGQELTRA